MENRVLCRVLGTNESQRFRIQPSHIFLIYHHLLKLPQHPDLPRSQEPHNTAIQPAEHGQTAHKTSTLTSLLSFPAGSLSSIQKCQYRPNIFEGTHFATGATISQPCMQFPASPPLPGSQTDAKPWKLFFHLQHLVPWQTPRVIMFIALKLSQALLHGFAAFGL